MATDATLLAIGVDSSGVQSGTAALAGLETQAGRTEASTTRFSQSMRDQAAIVQRQMEAMNVTSLQQANNFIALSDAAQRVIARYDPLGAKLRSLQADFARLNDEVTRGAGAGSEDAIDKTYAALNAEIAKTQGLMATASGAMETGFAAAEGGARRTGLATAQATRELIVLGHEALVGNFSRIPGSFLVLGERIGLTGVNLSKLVLTLGPAAAIVALLIKAIADGVKEFDAFNEAIAKSGDYAGVTRGQMRDLAQEIATTTAQTVGSSKSLIEELVGSGRVGAQSLGAVAQASAAYAQATGDSLEKAGQAMVKIFTDPARGAVELNSTMHILTVAQVEYIKQLQQAGDVESARVVLADKIIDALGKEVPQLGLLARAWEGLKKAASAGWDALEGIGRPQSDEEKLQAQFQTLAKLQAVIASGGSPTLGRAEAEQEYQAGLKVLDNLRQQVSAEQQDAAAKAADAAQTEHLQGLADKLDSSTRGRIDAERSYLAQLKASHDQLIANGESEAKYQSAVKDAEQAIASLENRGNKGASAFQGAFKAATDEAIKAQIALTNVGATAETRVTPAMQKLQELQASPAWQKFTDAQREQLTSVLQSADAFEREAKAMSDAQRATQQAIASIDHMNASNQDATAKLVAQVAALDEGSKAHAHAAEAAAENALQSDKMLAVFAAMDAVLPGLSDAVREHALAVAKDRDAEQAYLDVAQQIAADGAKAVKDLDEQNDRVAKHVEALKEQALALGLTKEQYDQLKAAQLDEEIATEQGSLAFYDSMGIENDAVEALRRHVAVLIQLRDAQGQVAVSQAAADQAKAWKQASNSIENDLMNAFDGWVNGAKNLGQQLRDDLLKMFDTLILRPILQPIAGSIAGLAFPGAASASGGGIGGLASDANGVLNMGSMLSGAGSFITGLGGSFAGGVGSSLANIGDVGLFSGIGGDVSAGMTALGAGNILGGLGSLAGAALPVVGIGLAIAAAAGLFNQSHGPKSGGFGQTGSDFGRFYTPSGQDSSLVTLANTSLTSYNTLLSSLGGTGSANFGFGFDEDPNGTANSRVSAGATVNGKRVYDVLNQDAGRGDKGVQADLQLDAQRAILAALQASNLPKDIANILDSVAPSTATLAQIQQVEELATAYGDLTKEMTANPLQDALQQITTQAQGAYGAFGQQTTAFEKLLSTYDGSTAATTALDTASQGYYQSLVALLAQIQQVKQSTDSMFSDTIRGFKLKTLDSQGQYGFYQSDVSALMKQLSTAPDPTTVQNIETLINSDLQAAFGLLDPSQQQALLGKFTAAANAADTAGNLRLTNLGAGATTTFQSDITAAQKAIKDAADSLKKSADTIAAAASKQGTAADTQTNAANTNLRAAQTPVTLNVNVNGTTGAEVNIG